MNRNPKGIRGEEVAVAKGAAVAVLPAVVEQVPETNNEIFQVGGRLFHFRRKWTFSQWAQSIVTNDLGWKWKFQPPPLRRFYQQRTQFLEELVQELERKRW